jgi:GTPase
VVHDLDTGTTKEITHIGERILSVRGGRGGKGNYMFRSSTNTSPRESTKGNAGESHGFRLELKMIADIGFIGLPNAGKTSLLNELTNAAAKVGNYAFTTLEPNLGTYYTLIFADIPGLIEGASAGKGLGTKFLRHIERTKTLFHLISAETTDVVRDYEIVRNELKTYSPALTKKPEYVFLSKSDMVSSETVQEMLNVLATRTVPAIAITVLDEAGLAPVKKALEELAREKISS